MRHGKFARLAWALVPLLAAVPSIASEVIRFPFGDARETHALESGIEPLRSPPMRIAPKSRDPRAARAAHADAGVGLRDVSGNGVGLAGGNPGARPEPHGISAADAERFAVADVCVRVGLDDRGPESWPDGDYDPSDPGEPDDSDSDTELAGGVGDMGATSSPTPDRSRRPIANAYAPAGSDGAGGPALRDDPRAWSNCGGANGIVRRDPGQALRPSWPLRLLHADDGATVAATCAIGRQLSGRSPPADSPGMRA